MQENTLDAITAHPRYQQLIRARKHFAITLTVLMLSLYYGFILIVAFVPEWLAVPLAPGLAMTWGIPIAVAVIFSAFLLTGIYVYRANSEFDQITKEIQEEFE